jgi:hypothetical protein
MDVSAGQHLLTVSTLVATGPPFRLVAYNLQYASIRLHDSNTLMQALFFRRL